MLVINIINVCNYDKYLLLDMIRIWVDLQQTRVLVGKIERQQLMTKSTPLGFDCDGFVLLFSIR